MKLSKEALRKKLELRRGSRTTPIPSKSKYKRKPKHKKSEMSS